jgi:hypothetical protein
MLAFSKKKVYFLVFFNSLFLYYIYIFFVCLSVYKGFDFPGIDGRADTRLIYGIIVVEERVKLVREGKVDRTYLLFLFSKMESVCIYIYTYIFFQIICLIKEP